MPLQKQRQKHTRGGVMVIMSSSTDQVKPQSMILVFVASPLSM